MLEKVHRSISKGVLRHWKWCTKALERVHEGAISGIQRP